MSLPLSPSQSPNEVTSNPNLTFRFPTNRPRPAQTNGQPALPSSWKTPDTCTQSELSQQSQATFQNSALPQPEIRKSKASLCPKVYETDIGRVTSPACAAGPSSETPRGSPVTEPNFEFPGDLPVEESNEPNLRDLYLKGQTYTLAMIVEEVLAGVSLFGAKANKYQLCIKRIQALDRTAALAESKQTSEWDDSDTDRKHKASLFEKDDDKSNGDKAKQKRRLAEHAEKWLSDMEEEGKKLLSSLRSLLGPLEKSAATLRNSVEYLPSLSDADFWATDYDEKLKRALQWDAVAQLTTLDHLLPQYLPIYNTLAQLLTREFPSATALEEIIPEDASRKAMANLVRTIFRTAVEIKFQAKELSLLTRNFASRMQNNLMSLQWHTKELLGVMECGPIYKGLRQEAEADEQAEGEQNHPPHTTHDKRIIIIGTLTHIILALRQLRLPDDKHIITLPTSYLHISTNSEDIETSTFHQEEKQILSYLTDFTLSVAFFQRYLTPNLEIIDPKFLLPFFLEIGAYTRGTMLTHADKLLSGWVVWREICLTVGGWESLEGRVSMRDQNIVNYALLGMRPGENLSRANSDVSTSTILNTINTTSSTKKGKGPAESSGRPGSFKHKFSFKLIPIPPANELAPKCSLPTKDSLPTFDPIPQLTQASQRLLEGDNTGPQRNTEFSLPTQISGLEHLAGPPQKIWPAAALAVQSRGMVLQSQEENLVYMRKTDGPAKTLLDENFSLEDVLRFYAAAMEEQKMKPFSVPGSSVARVYWQMKQMDKDRKKNEELIDALLSPSEPSSPIKKFFGTDKSAKPQRTSTERRKSMISKMMKRLGRFALGRSDSTAASAKNSKNPTKTTTKSSTEGADPSHGLPAFNPPSFLHLDEEQTNSITTCFDLRRDFRATLRLLSEMKTVVKCLFDGEEFMRVYYDASDMGMELEPEFRIPKTFLDRECAWRKVPSVTSVETTNDTAADAVGSGKEKKRMELD
ncbi:hypothetical protein EV426DRAFT_702041 [Tirmania nivea]|nr:hypothetical protein EV426DRAFT_702041 [Tirmania nivea]